MIARLAGRRRVAGTVAEMSDAALLAAVAASDRAALGAFYDRFHGDVYRFVARLAGTMDTDLDDLVQSTFLAAYRGARSFRGTSSVKTWLFGIGANTARDYLRREGRRQSALQRLAVLPAMQQESPDKLAARAELLRRLDAAIAELSPAMREAYVLCVIEEVPGKEAARALGIREATLWRRLHDARKALRGALERSRS